MAKRWYVIHTYSGYENKVKADLLNRIESMELHDRIFDIQIPTETVTEIKEGGKRVTQEKIIMPGYVLVRMIMDDKSWSAVRGTTGVTGFVGPQGHPEPLSRAEYQKIMRRTGVEPQTPRATTTDVEVGQTIKVVSGPLADFEGTVSEIDLSAGKVKVMVSIFGRETPVELSFDQIASTD